MVYRPRAIEHKYYYYYYYYHYWYLHTGLAPPIYRLVGVVMVMRHGDRSPMYALPNHVGPRLSCALVPTPATSARSKLPDKLADDSADIVSQYVAAMQSVLQSKSSVPTDKLFHRFGLYPTSPVCYGAQLTASGAVQMLHLGQFLRSRYSALFDTTISSDTEDQVAPMFYVRSTEYPRTFQSAVALLYGLSGPAAVSSSAIETTRSIYFCSESATNLSCACAAAGKLQSAAKRNRTYSDDERKIRTEIGNVFNVSAGRLPWMPAMMEARIV